MENGSKKLKTPTHRIFLDWDDTLYPSTWYRECGEQRLTINLFQELDRKLATVLLHLSLIGEIRVVTNASMTWYEATSDLVPTAKKMIHATSARDLYQFQQNDPADWKTGVFKFFKYPGDIVLSFGDKAHDHRDDHELCVYFKENPSLNDIMLQLDLVMSLDLRDLQGIINLEELL